MASERNSTHGSVKQNGAQDMASKRVVVIGAGPCGLVALKEMREAGMEVVAVETRPDIGGIFCRKDDRQYTSLYLTISNFFMAYSDFPPPDMTIRYWSKTSYAAYLEAYADHFDLRKHIRFQTEVVQARHENGRWSITVRTQDGAQDELDADVLLVATGSNHHPRRMGVSGFTGQVLHSSEYTHPQALAGKHVLVVGAGESAFDVAADVAEAGGQVTVWSRSPIAPAPRFPVRISFDPQHDELKTMKAEEAKPTLRVSDFLEVMTASRMANAAPLWAYSAVRHAIFAALRGTSPQGKLLSFFNRYQMADPLLGDQISVPTKSARLCTVTAQGSVRVIVAKEASFRERTATFRALHYQGNSQDMDVKAETAQACDIDTIVLCTGFRTDFSWLSAPGLDWNPRTWYKHCFPPGWGDRLMFLGWARPHQGGIPGCAEMLSRYIGLILRGERALPDDWVERAAREGQDEHLFYVRARHSLNLVDYFAFMDSLSKQIGCYPEPPAWSKLARRLQWWMYPSWPIWYRLVGPGARPELVEKVMTALPLGPAYLPNPFILLAFVFSLMQPPIDAILKPRPGLEGHWAWKAKKFLLHGNG